MNERKVIVDMQTRAGAILRDAAGIVDGARNLQHGPKERSFVAIAALWDAYLANRPGGRDTPISAADVAMLMVLLKMMRAHHGSAMADHFVDMAGYAAIAGELSGV